MPKIGVVTVTYNSRDVLDDFMQSLIKQNHQDWVLYIVDNDSKDDTLQVLPKYMSEKVKLILNQENYGVAKGNNQGIDAAILDGCDYILLLNNDTVFDESLLKNLLGDLIANNVDMVCPKMMCYEPNNMIWCAGGYFKPWQAMKNIHRGENEVDSGQYDKIYECDYVPTCCVLIEKSLFSTNSVGLMDEKYFVYCDDTDWMYRAKLLGKKLIYTPNTLLYHKVSSLTGGALSPFSITMHYRNKIYFYRKHYSGVKFAIYLSYFLLITCLKLIIGKSKWSDSATMVKAIIKGFKL